MDIILQFIQQRKAWVALVSGAIVGLLLGLAIGWWWWPVQWVNSTPANLRSDFQNEYILWVAGDYAEDGDLEQATRRLGVPYWKEGQIAETLDQVEQAYDGQKALNVRRLARDLEVAPAGAEEPAPIGAARLRPVAMVCGIGLLVVAVVGGGFLLFARLRERREAPAGAGVELGPSILRRPAPAEGAPWEGEPPQAQFVTTYVLGDDHYDPSFSIETETGAFMGECGVGISETVGVGEPSKVTAFEVWLFDKNDIRTVTKVLMSEYAFNDEALRTKLAPKGEPVLVEEDKDVMLDTRMLRVRAHVVEADYGKADLPGDSFFERLTVELAAWVKPEAEEAGPTTEVTAPDELDTV